MPGTIWRPLAKLCAQRMPGFTTNDAAATRPPQLIAIVQRGVAEPGLRWTLRAVQQDRVAQLMRLRPDRPFLGERECPGGRTQRPLPGADVLDDSRFLVVGLFNQEAVVGDGARLGDGRTAGRPDGQKQQREDAKVFQSANGRTSRSTPDSSRD